MKPGTVGRMRVSCTAEGYPQPPPPAGAAPGLGHALHRRSAAESAPGTMEPSFPERIGRTTGRDFSVPGEFAGGAGFGRPGRAVSGDPTFSVVPAIPNGGVSPGQRAWAGEVPQDAARLRAVPPDTPGDGGPGVQRIVYVHLSAIVIYIRQKPGKSWFGACAKCDRWIILRPGDGC
ncbi:hypothetical protein HNR25_001541 [Streptomonospora salina]|uniref:Uncharacterized protein n=1 Tax=Streptomonospora salina TaxID=104205 RepID=A0A841EBB8_9ACTN|nr:hypothetical protein [Streptomonospora salina]